MAAMAKKHAGGNEFVIDFEPWHALQRWLQRGPLEVVIPFAGGIAAGIHPVAVRLRRDFAGLMHLVQAHAVLHRATRKLDERGRIIAELGDYSTIFELVDPLLAEGVGVSVSQTMRETVHAVASIAAGQGTASVTEVAQLLSLDTSSASRRIHAALKKGFLENEEQQPRRKARLIVGTPLPATRGLLPPPDSLQVCRANGGDT